MTSLSLKDLSIGYTHNRQTRLVMGKINASLQQGELVALIGANGAGKSTLLRTIAAYQRPLDGTITYPDGTINPHSPAELSTRLAVVLTSTEKALNIKIREIVALGRMPYTNIFGKLRSNDNMAIEQAMRMVGVEHLAERHMNTLSDGERQKTMIAKALAQETSIIILDEPTAFLDFGSRVQLMRMLKKLAHEQKKAILVSTHDLELALQIADRIWLMHNGNMHTGDIRELTQSGVIQSFINGEGIRYDSTHNRIELI